MILKGFDTFREKTPILRGKRIIILPIYVLIVIFLSFFMLTQFYSFPDIFQNSVPNRLVLSLFPLLGVVLLEFLGFFLVDQMWFWRTTLKQRYGLTSYQHIFFVGLAGITMIILLAMNVYIPLQQYSPVFWQAKDFSNLIMPFETFIGLGNDLEKVVYWMHMFLAVVFLLVGILMMLRAVTIFGIDYMTVIYLYFPEESRLQNNDIYSALRHPMYAGVIFFALGGFFANFTLYSLMFVIIYVCCFYFHIHFIEEPELITRFGDSYKRYQKEVHAFFASPTKIPLLLKFLFNK